MPNDRTAGWSTNWTHFLNTSEDLFLEALIAFHSALPWTDQLDPAQKRAWQHEYAIMQATLRYILDGSDTNPDSCWIAFEQELPGEAGKRAADVNIVLPSGHLFVIEFKDKPHASEHEIWRAAFDLNTLLRFHSESIDLEGRGYLALTRPDHSTQIGWQDEIYVETPNAHNYLEQLATDIIQAMDMPHCYSVSRWATGHFYRQPSILAGTVDIFFNEHIPTLHTDAGQNIQQARQTIQQIYQKAKYNKERYLVLVGGAPGAGKTLLGLSAVADTLKEHPTPTSSPVYLSGNNPLVGVLQYTLDYYGQRSRRRKPYDARSLIQKVLDVKKQCLSGHVPYDLIVFDEAQRAWDSVKGTEGTELDLFCQWLSRKEYGVVILLVGDGQAIHKGEMPLETLFQSLLNTIQSHQHRIQTVIPSNYRLHFPRDTMVTVDDTLYLTEAIRQQFAANFEVWLEAVINNQPDKAHEAAQALGPFPLKITHSPSAAETFARDMHAELHQSKPGKADQFRYGWLTSSKSGNRSIRQLFGGSNPAQVFGPWYVDHPSDPDSCCQLHSAATEFGCQGLEVALALVLWGNDFLIRNGNWQLNPNLRREHDDFTSATYRILLSRGRSGLVVCCEDAETYQYLQQCGMSKTP